jgi:hypothetical protein
MPRARLDIASIVAAAGVAVLGALVLLDGQDVLRLRFAVLGPVACATVGATLLAMGLTRRG